MGSVCVRHMATTFTTDNPRCDHKTKIVTQMKEDGMISITIASSCKNVQAYAKDMTSIQMKDIAKRILENPVYVKASPVLGPECIVPCAVISAVWTEAGFLARSLLRKFDTMAIKYEDEKPYCSP
jgi:hypothetical protein